MQHLTSPCSAAGPVVTVAATRPSEQRFPWLDAVVLPNAVMLARPLAFSTASPTPVQPECLGAVTVRRVSDHACLTVSSGRALFAEARGPLAAVRGNARRGRPRSPSIAGAVLLALGRVDELLGDLDRHAATAPPHRCASSRANASASPLGRHLVDQAEPQRLGRVTVSPVSASRFTAGPPERRTRRCVPDQPGTAPMPRLGQAEPRLLLGDAEIGGRRELEPAAERAPVEHRDQRLAQAGQARRRRGGRRGSSAATCRAARARPRRRCRRRRRRPSAPPRSGWRRGRSRSRVDRVGGRARAPPASARSSAFSFSGRSSVRTAMPSSTSSVTRFVRHRQPSGSVQADGLGRNRRPSIGFEVGRDPERELGLRQHVALEIDAGRDLGDRRRRRASAASRSAR